MALEMAKSVAALKSAVYSVQLSLLDGISDKEKLQAAGRVLTQSEYADVVTERSIINSCGYPLCTNLLPSSFPRKGRYHISLREHKVYDIQETRLFCSSDCLVASKSFSASLTVERDYSSTTQTLEFTSAYHNCGAQDGGAQHDSSSVSSKRGPVLIQELDGQCQEDEPFSVDLLETLETVDIGHTQQLDSGTFLLIREQNESRVTEFSVAGPSDAIDGYIPKKEVRTSCQKQVMEEKKKQKSANSSSKNIAKLANNVKKKEKKGKTASSINQKESEKITSFDSKVDFTSCILVDDIDWSNTNIAKDMPNFESSSNESATQYVPQIDGHKEGLMRKSGQHWSRKHKRVSWADNHNQNLVEDLCPSRTATENVMSTDTSKMKVPQGEDNRAVLPENSSSDRRASKVIVGNELSKNREGFCITVERDSCRENETAATQGSSSSAVLQPQDIPHVFLEHENIQGTTIYTEDEGGRFLTPEIVAVPIGDGSAILEREDNIGGREGHNEDFQNENLESVKALVAALTDAAESVACGEAESSEAAARAGISIVPKQERSSSHQMKESEDMDREQDIDDETIDPINCWYSAPPMDFKPELSGFGTLWMALDCWISATSIAHLYGRDTRDEESFTSVNGKEYLRQVTVPDGISAEIERTVAGCISRTLPRLVEILRFPVPVSTLEVSLGRLLRTMSFMSAIPAFSSKQWQVVTLILLDGLSVHRLPALRHRFSNGRQLIQKVLASANITEVEYQIFRDLVLPMGMLPYFAAHCGA